MSIIPIVPVTITMIITHKFIIITITVANVNDDVLCGIYCTSVDSKERDPLFVALLGFFLLFFGTQCESLRTEGGSQICFIIDMGQLARG